MDPSHGLRWVIGMLKLNLSTINSIISPLFWLTYICDCQWILTAFTFSKKPIEPQANTELQDVIEISSDDSDEESKDEENNKSKKRTRSNSAATGPPSKRRVTLNTAIEIIEVLDSDDEISTTIKAVPMKAATGFSDPRPVTVKLEVESSDEKMTSSGTVTQAGSNEAAKDKDGRYIVTQKVKVDSIEYLQEVPARWPIPPEGINTAYVIDLNNDKKWQELDPNSKKKQLDSFIKREVSIFISLKPSMIRLSKPYYFRIKIPGGRGPTVQLIIKSPSGSLRISPPAAQFINAMGQGIAKCLTMQSCKAILEMMHMI